jgi:hypothetical protein
MRDRALWLQVPTSPPLVLGIVVAAALIAAATLVMFSERRVAPEISFGVVFLPGVLVVWTLWGLAFGAATAVLRWHSRPFSPSRALRAGGSEAQPRRDVEEVKRGGADRERVVGSVQALLRAEPEREGMGSAVAR